MAFIIWVLAVLLVIEAVRRFVWDTKKMQLLKKLPGPKPQFLVGNLMMMKDILMKNPEHPTVFFLERALGLSLLYQKQGFFNIWASIMPHVFVFNPELMEIILSSKVSLEKAYEYKFLHPWLRTGLLTSKGAKWKSRRKLLNPTFRQVILEEFFPAFNANSQILLSKVKSMHHLESVDINPLVSLCILDIMCETLMGFPISAQQTKNEIYDHTFYNLADLFYKRGFRPWLHFDSTYRFTKMGKDYDKYVNTIHDFTVKMILERKAQYQKREPQIEEKQDDSLNKNQKPFLEMLIDTHMNSENFSVRHIQEEVDTFLFEGHETTTAGIIFTLYALGLYPNIQKKVYEELTSIFGDDKQRPVTVDDTRNLKYMECVLKESQRIFPPIPLIGRKLDEDIFYNEYVIPKGTTVFCMIMSLHRNAEVFPDPEIFDPERFSTDKVSDLHAYGFVPFSAGPRNCIGQKFAFLAQKVVLSNILRNYSVSSLHPRDNVLVKPDIHLKPIEHIRMTFHPRK